MNKDTRGESSMKTIRIAPALAALFLSAVALTGCQPAARDAEVPAEVARNVRVLEVGTTDFEEYYEISGPLRPLRGTDVFAEESGNVDAIVHDKGERVEIGDVLVALDRRLLAAQVEAARADLELQAYNAEQTARLQEAGKVSRLELLQAEALHGQAKAALATAELRHERAEVPAPFAGLVADRYVERGQLVAPGMRVARVIDPYVLKLEGALTERDVAFVREGAVALVVVDGVDEPVPGRVAWLSFEADPVTGKFQVEVRVDNRELALRAGVVGRAKIHKRTQAGLVVVPRDAILEGSDGHMVFVLDGDRARSRLVKLGADQGLLVAVIEGLAAGERLVVRGQREVVDGALVAVTETATRRDGTLEGDPDVVGEAASAPRGAAEEAAR
jgi:membrane fusion protein (multidrug efflux system)